MYRCAYTELVSSPSFLTGEISEIRFELDGGLLLKWSGEVLVGRFGMTCTRSATASASSLLLVLLLLALANCRFQSAAHIT